MATDLFFYWMFNLLIVISIIAVMYVIFVLYRTNKILKRWDKVSEKLSISILDVIPAVVTANNVVKGVQKVFQIVEEKKEDSKKEK